MPSWLKHVLLSEFDIDTGSKLSVAYPPLPDGTDSSFFADMMLPEGMHLRENDWTVFFLTPSPRVAEATASSSAEGATPSTVTTPTAGDANDGVTFCLNMAGRRLDRTTRRGAHVKALALCTSHHFLVAFKEGLAQALELVFESPTLATVQHIYDAFAAVSFDALPSLNRAERCMRRPLILDSSTGKATLRPDSIVSASVRLRCPMLVPDDLEAEAEAEAEAGEGGDGGGGGSASAGRAVESAAAADAGGEGAGGSEVAASSAELQLRRRQSCIHALIPVRVPLYLEPEDTGLTRASGAVRRLLLMFGTSFIKIWQAVLLEKRVIFSAHKQAASEACEAVLALCTLFRPLHGCGIIARAFPHATLSTMDQVSLFCTVTFRANPSHNLTRSP
jgi:hypothetical protein